MTEQLSKQERRRLKREQRRQRKQEREQNKRSSANKTRILTYGILAIILVGGGIGISSLFASLSNSPIASLNDLSDIPSSFVHWHADLDLIICGENYKFPEAIGGGLIGDQNMHTHSSRTNQQSFSGQTDGNGVIHNEGLITQDLARHTIGRFLSNLYVQATETSILGKTNGDECPDGTTGEITATLNGAPLENFISYIPRDRDKIIITFAYVENGKGLVEVKEFSMTAKQWDFTPSTITVNKGDTVKLNINSVDVTHGFALTDFGVNARLDPGKITTVEFVADKSGTFSFFCSVKCGSGHLGMTGQLIVNE